MNVHYHPVADLTDKIAAARTYADLADARHRLQHTIGILDSERMSLAAMLNQREQDIILLGQLF